MSDADTTLHRTALYERHQAAGARLVPFAGWEMPVQYAGVREEHLAVRQAAGVFDVSHMGQVETAGPQATAFLQRLLSNDVESVPVGGAQYALLCREDGGVLDDLFSYRLGPDQWLTVTNAANHAKDVAWFSEQAQAFDVAVRDATANYAMLAVQGPLAREIAGALSDGPLPKRMTAAPGRVANAQALICGTGYTGEDGVEILCAPADAPRVWDELIRRSVTPAGLAARDTLRLEAGFHLYGNDLMESRDPISGGLGWAVKEDTGFIGAEACRAVREAGPAEKLVGFVVDDGIARQGNAIVGGGVVTSGTMAPSLGVAIGMGYVPAAQADLGTALEIDVRGRARSATVVKRGVWK
jgi:aminomethyltransferase